jgi:hypothetical protein
MPCNSQARTSLSSMTSLYLTSTSVCNFLICEIASLPVLASVLHVLFRQTLSVTELSTQLRRPPVSLTLLVDCGCLLLWALCCNNGGLLSSEAGRSDADESETSDTEASSSADQNGTTAAPSQPAAEINPASLIAFDEAQAAKTAFPPGCPVLHVNAVVDPPIVTIGIVHSVAYNVTSSELIYSVTPINPSAGDHILTSEAQLQLTPRCKVQAQVNDGAGMKSVPAIVLTSYQPTPDSVALYSIQEDFPRGALFHGIPQKSIEYRPVATTAAATTATSTTQSVGVASNAAVGRAEVSQNQSRDAGQANTVRISPTHEEPPTAMNTVVTSKDRKRPFIPVAAAKRSIDSCKEDDASGAPAAAEQVSAKRRKSNERAQSPNSCVRMTDPLDTELMDPQNDHPKSPAADAAASQFSYASLATTPSHQEPVIDTKFIVPGCAFTVETIKGMSTVFAAVDVGSTYSRSVLYLFSFCSCRTTQDFATENVNNMIHDTHCQLHLKIERGDRSIRKSRAIYFQLRGTQEATTKAIHSLERSLVATLDPHEKGRALYYMLF